MKITLQRVIHLGLIVTSVALVVLIVCHIQNTRRIERLEERNQQLAERLRQAPHKKKAVSIMLMAHWFIILVRSLVRYSGKLSPAEAADEFDTGNMSVLLRGLASPAEA